MIDRVNRKFTVVMIYEGIYDNIPEYSDKRIYCKTNATKILHIVSNYIAFINIGYKNKYAFSIKSGS